MGERQLILRSSLALEKSARADFERRCCFDEHTARELNE
jgi:hypothetical protein